ncbi:MAG: Holliday junction resolvase RuvX, partial [Bacteroidales bacterium]|nr:Holliday junction resolvase RuvX [Bacteroidales bacterium]
MEGRILAIDYGTKRVGLAVTDPLQIIANKLTTVSANEVFPFIEDYLKKEKVVEIVVGYPKQMNNKPSENVKHVVPFVNRLKKTYPDLTINYVDERFTSKMALQTMIEGGMKKKNNDRKREW